MPFEGLARSISQEHEAADLERQRSPSVSSRTGFERAERSMSRRSERRATGASSDETLREEDEEAEARDADEEEARSEKGVARKEAAGGPPQEEDPFLVTMKGREKQLSPHHWSATYRWFLTAFVGFFVLNATFASSAPSNLIPSLDEYFGVSQEVGVLLISIFVAGYCIGPILWGPLSERYGRRKIMIASFIPYVGFQVGCALSKNTASIIIFRFLGGCFASSPLTASGAVIADIWDADRRGDALAIFALMPFAGPALAPIISGTLQVKHIDWRWIFWILTIFAGACLVAMIFLLPETYAPYLLYKEAKRLRKETGDDRWHAALEKKGETFGEILSRTVNKPFRMAIEEPMLLVMTLYMSFIYGVVYLLFEAVPIIFEGIHGLNALQSGLVFLALLFGGQLGVITYIFYFNPQYKKYHHSLNGKPVPPEYRLRPMLIAGPLLPVAFFWVGWTSYKSINIASPIIAIVLLGLCILWIFLGVFNYLIDSYLANAASALSFNTVMRSAFGAGFPLFASQMYKKLGTPGASSLLGGIAILFMPMPFLLSKYGKKIRSMSKNAVVRADE